MEKIEQIILGTILIDNNAFYTANSIIKPEMFYFDKNHIIYESLIELNKKGILIDLITVVNNLRERKELDNVGGAYYVSCLTSLVSSGSHIESHCQILAQSWMRREMVIKVNQALVNLADEQIDINDIYHDIVRDIDSIFDLKLIEFVKLGKLINERIKEIEQITGSNGIPTGFKQLDSITGGWQNSDLIILAARPSMGKTFISLKMALAPLIENKNVLYFSLEMSKERLTDRVIGLNTGINSKKINRNNLDQNEWSMIFDCSDMYENSNLYINDESGLTIEQISAKCVNFDRKNKIGLVVIDYLQLIKQSLAGNKNDNSQVSHISRNCKVLAKKLKCPVIALSQLSRDVDSRANKRPFLSDLRDSGAIEQDADIVIFLYRDEYYFPDTDQKNIIEMIIAKHRNGETCMIELNKNDNWTKISDTEISEDIPF